MLQHGIGAIVGALVSLLLLVIMAGGDPWQDYVTPLVIGGLATFFWPIVIAFWLGRRAKARRENQVSAEVQRQLDQQNQGR
jgi:O-antigen/teichoic acid export membrane protein